MKFLDDVGDPLQFPTRLCPLVYVAFHSEDIRH